MQLTGKEIIERGIITNVDLEHAVQQQGVDVRIKAVNSIRGFGRVPAEGKTQLPEYVPVPTVGTEVDYWALEPGCYEIVLEEGCKIPKNIAMYFIQRSSLSRCGAVIKSSQFDAGFETEHMGTFMQVFHPIRIEVGARVAQAICHETADVENLYNGQWQKDNQRK